MDEIDGQVRTWLEVCDISIAAAAAAAAAAQS